MEKDITFGKCYICGNDIEFNEDYENCSVEEVGEEGNLQKTVICPHCGTTHIALTNKNEKDEIICGDQGFGNCFECGSTLVWSSDFMRSDYYNDENMDENDDAIVRNLTCSGCGSYLEVWEPSENEKNDTDFQNKYTFWKK